MNMNLKGIMNTLGVKPGQVVSNPYVRAFAPQVESIVKEEEDHEVSMAQNQLDSIIKSATELKAKIGEGEKNIPAWIQDHITNSENYISQASSNYHEYGTNEAVELPATPIPSSVKVKLMAAIDKIKDSNLNYNQKIQVVGKVMDSLGIDKAEFNKMASKLRGTMEGKLNESNAINETKFIAFFMGKKIDVEGKDLWDAKQKAILHLKVPKSKLGLLAVVSAESQKNQDFRFESEERPSLTNITRSIVTTPVIGDMIGSRTQKGVK